MIRYPLQLTFRIVAIAPQIAVRDADGTLLLYVKQKAFKLRESVTIFADEAQAQPVARITADRVIDFNARYDIESASGGRIGSVRREGMRSLWRSQYAVADANGREAFTIREANPWAKVADGLFGEIPVVGMLSGYLFHPAYVVARADGTEVFRVTKQPAFFEGKYEVARVAAAVGEEEALALPAMLMLLLLERTRG